ncbi:MAG: peptide-modifying radical SAM enzyme CbpB [bacterium]
MPSHRGGAVALHPDAANRQKEQVNPSVQAAVPSRGRYLNSGTGPSLHPVDIGHADYLALVDPDTAFWSLVPKADLSTVIGDARFLATYRRKSREFASEMQRLRFGLKPNAVYVNPTTRCNLNCQYCYIPQDMRQNGDHMCEERMFAALDKLQVYYRTTLPKNSRPQVVFHGAEPLLNKTVVFNAIKRYGDQFRFGIQTNATLLDEEAIQFLTSRNISIGLSLDGHTPRIADRTRVDWNGRGAFETVVQAMDRLHGYPGLSVICTVTDRNLPHLAEIADFLHQHEVPTCLMNVVRCTLPAARTIKPDDSKAAQAFTKALDKTYEIYRQTGRKLIVANFANILISILAPTARRLMCDISPCGGGRCFFAMDPSGDLFPCSEFIGLPAFKGGNVFKDSIDTVLQSDAFRAVTGRRVEDIEPCRRCAIRHFCGSPCPAEAYEVHGAMNRTGSFCEFYEEQARYAFRVIADGKQDAYLWDGWDKGTTETFRWNLK